MAKTRDLHRTQVWLPVPMVEWLKKRASEQGVSYAELVRQALDLYRDFKEGEAEAMQAVLSGAFENVVEAYEEEESEVLARLGAVEETLARIEKRLGAII